MAFFKFPWFGKRSDGAEPAPLRHSSRAAQAQSVEQLRQRARHRLMGAAVLIGLGVIGFPMLFDSQPRPIPVDIPIEIPDRNQVAPLVVPGEQATTQTDTPDMQRVAKAPGQEDPTDDSLSDSEEWVPPVAPIPQPPRIVPAAQPQTKPVEAKAPAQPSVKAEPKPEPKPEPKTEPKPEAKPTPKPAPATRTVEQETARAKAILEGRTPPPATAPSAPAAASGERFIVQVGAFADVFAANEVRRKLEGIGLKTYTQAVNTKDGQRIRVRVGPFTSRDEAQKAADRAKSLGLAGAVLTL